MSKNSLFQQKSSASYFGKNKLPKDPHFRVQKPVYRSVADLMLAINNHPELIRPATSFDTDSDFMSEDERRYLDKMEMYDRLVARMDFDNVNNSVASDQQPAQEDRIAEEAENQQVAE